MVTPNHATGTPNPTPIARGTATGGTAGQPERKGGLIKRGKLKFPIINAIYALTYPLSLLAMLKFGGFFMIYKKTFFEH